MMGHPDLLPVEAYTSQEWFDREQRELFGHCWQFVCMDSDVPDDGDFVTAEIGAYPLVIIRAKGQLRAFHNICRHRGTQLLRVAGRGTKVIKCPYHDWTYSIEGELKTIPGKQRFPDVDMSKLGLHPAKIDVWRGMVFASPDPDIEPLEQWLGDMDKEFGPHMPEKLTEYEPALEYEVRANWKVFVENYIDGYHLTHLHSGTLANYDHANQQSRITHRHWAFFEPLAPKYLESLDKESILPLIDHIPKEKIGAYVHMLFPCFGISGVESIWSIVQIFPIGPALTRVKIRTWTMPITDSGDYWNAAKLDLKARFEQVKKERSLLSAVKFVKYALTGKEGKTGIIRLPEDSDPLESEDFMIEDMYACEQQQKAMRSPRFAIGPMTADLEDAIVQWHRHVAEFVPVAGPKP